PHSIEPGTHGRVVVYKLGGDDSVDLDHRDALEVAAQQKFIALDVDLVQFEAVSLGVQGDQTLDRLLAEMAFGPRVDEDLGEVVSHARRPPSFRRWRRRRSR